MIFNDTIEFRFQVCSEQIVVGSARPCDTWRWHGACPELLYHFLQDGRVVCNAVDADPLEHQSGRFQFFVVAGDAITIQQRTLS